MFNLLMEYLVLGLFLTVVALILDRPRASWRRLVGVPMAIVIWPYWVISAVRDSTGTRVKR